VTRSATPRRRRLMQAVLAAPSPQTASAQREEFEADDAPLHAIEGIIVDASPHLLVLGTASGTEHRMPMSGGTSIWHGERSGVGALEAGREVVVRPDPSGLVADRVWVDIVRVTGIITERTRDGIEVDAGPHRGRLSVAVPEPNLGRIMVRHPRLEPGYLLDVIGIRDHGEMIGLIPATPQPAYRADRIPSRPYVPGPIRGTATWYETTTPGSRGVAYPALDPWGGAGGCPDAPRSCAKLPYLSLGSEPRIRNDCSGRAAQLPIIECGCMAARFCDRCVHCGTSPRGRVVELTRAAFVDLGGDLDVGCFNVTVGVG
jgi:hypothetical protein